MNHDYICKTVEELLDAATARHPEGAKSQEVQHELIGQVAMLLAEEERDLFAEAERLLVRVHRGQRRERRSRMAVDMEYIVDAFGNDEDGAYIDPMLGLAYPIGTDDGQVKTLRNWTTEDFETSVRMAYRKSAEITASAREHDDRMTAAIASMRARGVDRFGSKS